MKKLTLITLAFSLLFVAELSASNKRFETRTATIKRDVSPNDLINIKAKNTDLVVESWDKNEVEITATVRFDGKMTDKMVSFLDNFQEYVEDNVEFSGGELRIKTNLDEPNKIQIGSKHIGIVIGFSEDEFKLDYKIKAPAINKFEIDNSYKDVSLIGDFQHIKLTQYSGELTADFIEKAELNMKYGSAKLKGMGSAVLEIYEQKLEVESIEQLEIDTKYSEIDVVKLKTMETASYESDFVLGKAEEITGNFKYGEMEIKNNLDRAEFDFYEMDIEANSAGTIEFKSSKYGKISFDQVSKLTFDQSYEDELTIGELGLFRSIDSKYGNHEIDNLTGSFELNAYEDDIHIREVDHAVNSIELKGKYLNTTLGISNRSFNLQADVKYGKFDYDKQEIEMKKYIKDGDKLEIEALSKTKTADAISISIEGYEIDVVIN